MSFGDALRNERLRGIWDEFRSASRKHGGLYHVCARSDDQDVFSLLSRSVGKLRDELWYEVLFSSEFQGMLGKLSRRPTRLRIGPTSWLGRYSFFAEEPDYFDATHKLAILAEEALVDFGIYAQPSEHLRFAAAPWLEVLYATVSCQREVVRLDAPALPKGSVEVTWLPWNVFLTSAKAIELLLEKHRAAAELTGPAN